MRFNSASNGGHILCPGCKCHVGQAKLSGIKCACGFYNVPGYCLFKKRVLVSKGG